MGRFVLRLLLFFMGVAALAWGAFLGLSSHQVIYKTVTPTTIAHYLAGQLTGTGYVQVIKSPTLYIVNESDFKPAIRGINTFLDNDVVSFVYESQSTTPIDVKSGMGTHLVGNAYKIVKITLYDNNNQAKIFISTPYNLHPQNYYLNNWPYGGGVLAVGALILLSAFFIPRRKTRVKAEPVLTMTKDTSEMEALTSYSYVDELEPDPSPQNMRDSGQFAIFPLQPFRQHTGELPTQPFSPTTQATGQFKIPLVPSTQNTGSFKALPPSTQGTGQFKALPSQGTGQFKALSPSQNTGQLPTQRLAPDAQNTGSTRSVVPPTGLALPGQPPQRAAEKPEQAEEPGRQPWTL